MIEKKLKKEVTQEKKVLDFVKQVDSWR